ncbi:MULTISPECIES: Na+/H+ antiporter NhaA [unclassified Arthrobacter]|uniref:Na+/H+ antiporter NhaA n=1 Tax=unclassified Arthrobacter TaxID=235627 RepID=UPI0024DFCE72|nr:MULTISPECIES: Na+/H+ antiporter NhaA [unclassified Arthrobacter]MCC9145811.1 Na+/H+ antiporter NhaA [Arthrobacter sp. zg-Y919]MDK1277040.1 Na+/H+ antiporter NhaA [Arthrobacter sp. zg.Y919]WIB03569.1 Na+/H+ antiporter NhaA [Arthrobacter sp. zg-Y919]
MLARPHRIASTSAPANGAGEKRPAALLLLATILAVLWANAPFAASYNEFWETTVEVRAGSMILELTARELINDALMAVFFFVVGLEVRREFALGELTNRSRAVVPVVAAAAGIAVPAAVFLLFTGGTEDAGAWGVVISTDTAFLLGALAIAGPRVPGRLRIFLLTLAVVDDVAALSIIALVYTDHLEVVPLLLAFAGLAAVGLTRYLPYGRGAVYAVLAVLVWLAFYASGVHPTLAGVGIALLVPVFPPARRDVERALEVTRIFRQSPNSGYARAAVNSVRESISINDRLHSAYTPYVDYLILPLFALANAGVKLDGATLDRALHSPLAWGIVCGLVLGKFTGIFGAAAMLRRLRIGEFGPGLTLGRIAGGAALSGIGFTIALFIIGLAIDDPAVQNEARVAVLAGSLLAFAAGTIIFRIVERRRPAVPLGEVLARPVDPSRDHIVGPPDAPLTLVEYGDYECPFCSRATGTILEVREHFGSELRYVWRHLPLSRVHPHAVAAAEAAEAAGRQGHFRDYSAHLFEHQDDLLPEDLLAAAESLGLDMDRFEADLRSAKVSNRVLDDALDAESMDLHGTPTFFVGHRRHHGPYDTATLIRALEASRKAVP